MIQSYSVLEYITKMLANYTFNMGVLNAVEFGAPQRRNRFVFIGIKKSIAKEIKMPEGTFTEGNYNTVKDAIKDIENVQTVFDTSKDIGTELTEGYEPTSLTPLLRDSKDCIIISLLKQERLQKLDLKHLVRERISILSMKH